MTEVIVTLRVMPKEAETDINKLQEKINSLIKPERISQEPIAFGLVALKVIKLIKDAEGELEKIENKLRSIPEVGEIEVTEVTRSI